MYKVVPPKKAKLEERVPDDWLDQMIKGIDNKNQSEKIEHKLTKSTEDNWDNKSLEKIVENQDDYDDFKVSKNEFSSKKEYR